MAMLEGSARPLLAYQEKETIKDMVKAADDTAKIMHLLHTWFAAVDWLVIDVHIYDRLRGGCPKIMLASLYQRMTSLTHMSKVVELYRTPLTRMLIHFLDVVDARNKYNEFIAAGHSPMSPTGIFSLYEI